MKLCSKCSTLKDESEFGNKPTSNVVVREYQESR